MPKQKDLKRLVRSRMKKTGESYTAARTQLTKKKVRTKASAPSVEPAIDYAKLAGMSDAAIKAKTGCAWEKWVYVLDTWGAREKTHTAIATHVHEKYKIDGWWSQAVTVGYERIRGLRVRGQRRDGSYEITKSKTFAVPIADLYRAFATAKARAPWLPDALKVRTATASRSMRVTWPDGTNVDIGFFAKGKKSQVAVAHTKLASKADADERKKFWAERLNALAELIE
jgi:hypothetical protein